MKQLLDRLARHASERPHAPALLDESVQLDYFSLHREVDRLSGVLSGDRVGLLLGNGAHWACLDLALLRGGRVCVPMPEFFSDSQLDHLIRDADLDMVATDNPERVADLLNVEAHARIEVAGRPVWLLRRHSAGLETDGQRVPHGTVKITYTSGTTGQPKGVCLSGETIQNVIDSLCAAVQASPEDRALSLLPLSTLLENIAGLYAPLWAGALAQVPGPASCGLAGSSGFQRRLLLESLQRYAPTTTILVPQLLKAITESIAPGMPIPGSLRFVALGGAPTPASLLERARSLGLPVFQGYGLSEAGSVACLNVSSGERAGSVGRPLPHLRVRIAEDGEVLVSGSLFLAYLGNSEPVSNVWPTGDLGYLDEDGFLFLTGRKKTAYATAYGRNVAPEWVESELSSHPLITQAAVFGEGQAVNVAVLVPRPHTTLQDLNAALDAVNTRLPDYARIGRWIIADQPFSPRNGLANGAGCMRREAVRICYQTRIEHLYLSEKSHAPL
jgi:long-chain acyl-CoA synthetase